MTASKKRRFKRKGKYRNRIPHGQSMEEYEERNNILHELGYKDYKAYLRSPLWKEIRARKIAKDKECYGCGRGDDGVTIQVHHGKYTLENLTGDSIEHMFTICARCHKWIEITKGGYKRTPETATIELFRLRKLYVMRRNVRNDPPVSRKEYRRHQQISRTR